VLAAAVLAASGVVLAGCSQDPNSVAAQAKAGDQKGYLSGDGTVEQIPAADRGEPVDLAGDLLGGGRWSTADQRGSVVVINVWGSWCPPCVAEIGDLQKVWDQVQHEKKDVHFIGIDYREDAARGSAFLKSQDVTYPSLTDESGVLILALQGKAPTIPTTLVLDTEGRIAGRISGTVNTSTLTGLIDDTITGP
jgi:thiol-disulfide isomerase/thioredoxin